MGLNTDIEDLKKEINNLKTNNLPPVKEEKKFEFKIKIPGKIKRAAKKNGVYAVLVIGSGRGRFTNGYVNSGLIKVDGVDYAFEEHSVFWIIKGKIPLVVIYEWRLTPVGKTDVINESKFLFEEEDKKRAEIEKLTNYGQQTIIRSIEQAQLPDVKKGFGGISPIAWLFIGVAVLYVLSQFFGGNV